mmetsp:Transcript_11243/g.16108  ORF Transcript_11243/g.16108 Transcript_11243/m.16108 type:complete len:234 (+) Transcript_11243:378-1079(+)
MLHLSIALRGQIWISPSSECLIGIPFTLSVSYEYKRAWFDSAIFSKQRTVRNTKQSFENRSFLLTKHIPISILIHFIIVKFGSVIIIVYYIICILLLFDISHKGISRSNNDVIFYHSTYPIESSLTATHLTITTRITIIAVTLCLHFSPVSNSTSFISTTFTFCDQASRVSPCVGESRVGPGRLLWVGILFGYITVVIIIAAVVPRFFIILLVFIIQVDAINLIIAIDLDIIN